MPFRKKNLLDFILSFLQSRFNKKPKGKQINKDWQLTKINEKINIYGEKRNPLGDMNKIATIIVTGKDQVLVVYTGNIDLGDLDLIVENLKAWGPQLNITTRPWHQAKFKEFL